MATQTAPPVGLRKGLDPPYLILLLPQAPETREHLSVDATGARWREAKHRTGSPQAFASARDYDRMPDVFRPSSFHTGSLFNASCAPLSAKPRCGLPRGVESVCPGPGQGAREETRRCDQRVEAAFLLNHEFVALYEPKLRAKRDTFVWEPSQGNLKFHEFRDAEAPVENARLRLSQMRRLAEQFAATQTVGTSQIVLRRVATLIARFQTPFSRQSPRLSMTQSHWCRQVMSFLIIGRGDVDVTDACFDRHNRQA
jgi:hypothetical protein